MEQAASAHCAERAMQQPAPVPNPMKCKVVERLAMMRVCTSILLAGLAFLMTGTTPAQTAARAQDTPEPPPRTDAEKTDLFARIISNQKVDDEALQTYERIERVEAHKGSAAQPPEVRVSRVVPAGTGLDRIPLGPDGKPAEQAAYRAELEKLEHALAWAAEDGRAQREAYEKVAKKQKEREDLIDATRKALLYTFVAREPRGDRMLEKYHMTPNPAYRATSRGTAIFAKIRGDVWIDPEAAQLARVEVEVTEDIAIGGFLAKIYKGSHLMQERYEMAPGVWLPTYSQYDFDGRKLFVSFGIHERTSYSRYRRVGPPREALAIVRAELDKLNAASGDP